MIFQTSIRVLILAWKLKAATQCEFSNKEFCEGLERLRCDDIKKLKKVLPKLEQVRQKTQNIRNNYDVQDLDSDKKVFRDFYSFTFNFGLNENQKSLEIDIALAYWQLVLQNRFRHLDLWLEFVKVRDSGPGLDDHGRKIV